VNAAVAAPVPPAREPRAARRLLRRLLLGLGIALTVLLLSAAVVEGALRLHGEYQPALFVRADGRVRLGPGHDAFVPVDVAEAPDSLRIVCMGASTMVGVPYEPVLSPPRWLALVLERRGIRAEVVSVAAPGLDSRDLLKLLPETLELHPDALIIATGHNEYLEAKQLLHPHWWDELRIGPIVARWLGAGQPVDALLPTPERDFDHVAVTEAFRLNIREMQALATRAGVPLLLCAEVSNLADFPPVLGDDPSADEDADTAYARGRTLLAADDRPGALAAFERARDRDRWPHRASAALNAAMRAEATHFVALDTLFAAQSETGCPGFDLFTDHCHPNPEGQRLMALGMADALEDLSLFPLTARRGTAPPLEEGLRLFGADPAMYARALAQVGRSLAGFALMRGAPGPLSRAARAALESAQAASSNRAGEVFASLALLDLLDGDRRSARARIEACRKASPAAILNLQRLVNGYPWVAEVFERNGLQFRAGQLWSLPP